MSKLSENLKVFQTHERVVDLPKLSFVSFASSSYEPTPYSIKYNLECTFKTAFLIKEGDRHNIEQGIAKSKRLILEEIFGEFRQDLYKIDAALYDRDYHKANESLQSMMKNMFDY